MPRATVTRTRKEVDMTRTRNTKSFVLRSGAASPLTRPSTIADDPSIAEAERRLAESLDQLVAIGAVKRENLMSVEEYLNLDEKLEQDAIDEEIVRQVKKEMGQEVESSDEDEDSSDDPGEPVPTRIEALRASLLLQRYLLYWNDPYAHDLWEKLSSFGEKTRVREKMEDAEKSKITDYFSSK